MIFPFLCLLSAVMTFFAYLAAASAGRWGEYGYTSPKEAKRTSFLLKMIGITAILFALAVAEAWIRGK
jgi:hypothetical protein